MIDQAELVEALDAINAITGEHEDPADAGVYGSEIACRQAGVDPAGARGLATLVVSGVLADQVHEEARRSDPGRALIAGLMTAVVTGIVVGAYAADRTTDHEGTT